MCFSAQASFLAAIGLAALYSYTIKIARTTSDNLLATTQLLFAIQQFCEGIVWVTLNHEDSSSWFHHGSVYSYLLFAFGLWPAWIPWILWLGEPVPTKKRMFFFFVLGSAVALSLIGITVWHGATASRYFRHIIYEIPAPWSISFVGFLLYQATTLVPLFLSRTHGMRFVAITATVGLGVSILMYRLFFISVWCFFAAVCSGLITLLIIRRTQMIKTTP